MGTNHGVANGNSRCLELGTKVFMAQGVQVTAAEEENCDQRGDT